MNMGNTGKSLYLALVVVMILLSAVTVRPVNSQTVASETLVGFDVLASSEGSNVHSIGLLIFAKDAKYNTVNTFTGSVYFTSDLGTIIPAVSGPFSKGFWRGSVDAIGVTSADVGHSNKITIYVNDGNGHTGSTTVLITSYTELPSLTPTMPTPTGKPSPTITPIATPSPSVPEFFWLTTLPLLLAIPMVLIIFRKSVSRHRK
jgi:hypothetical protein